MIIYFSQGRFHSILEQEDIELIDATPIYLEGYRFNKVHGDGTFEWYKGDKEICIYDVHDYECDDKSLNEIVSLVAKPLVREFNQLCIDRINESVDIVAELKLHNEVDMKRAISDVLGYK